MNRFLNPFGYLSLRKTLCWGIAALIITSVFVWQTGLRLSSLTQVNFAGDALWMAALCRGVVYCGCAVVALEDPFLGCCGRQPFCAHTVRSVASDLCCAPLAQCLGAGRRRQHQYGHAVCRLAHGCGAGVAGVLCVVCVLELQGICRIDKSAQREGCGYFRRMLYCGVCCLDVSAADYVEERFYVETKKPPLKSGGFRHLSG